MKIIKLFSENIKRLKAVEIVPEGNVVIISGKNENGKSSVLDSIWLALQYKEAVKEIPKPLRSGTDKATIEIDLGDYIVKRRITESGTSLEITTPDGSKINSPQKLLDGLVSEISFDPWAFLRKSEKEQRDLLADLLFKLTNGKVNLAEFDARHKRAYDERTNLNREKNRLTTLVGNMKPPLSTDPTEEKSAKNLTDQLQLALSNNQKIESLERNTADIQAQIDKLILQLEKEKKELSSLTKIDVVSLQVNINSLEFNNKRAREVIEYSKTKKVLEEIETKVIALETDMELCSIEKDEALESVDLPVQDLRIDAEGIQILDQEDNYVPLKQASSARGLKLSTAIAMALNPTLRVIRITDGSLLDDDSLAIIESMATEKDYQVWLEMSSKNDSDRPGIFIENGEVA